LVARWRLISVYTFGIFIICYTCNDVLNKSPKGITDCDVWHRLYFCVLYTVLVENKRSIYISYDFKPFWNQILSFIAWPPSCTLLLSSFKSGLKTHLFRQALDSCDIHWWNNLSQNISSTCRGDNVDIQYTTTSTTRVYHV